MWIQRFAVYALIAVLAAPSAMAAKKHQEAPEVWRTFAGKLEAGAPLKITLKDHTQVKGNFIVIEGDTLRVKPKTRIPVPLRTIPFTDVISIDRQSDGWSPGAKVAAGVGIGFGALLLIVAAVLSSLD